MAEVLLGDSPGTDRSAWHTEVIFRACLQQSASVIPDFHLCSATAGPESRWTPPKDSPELQYQQLGMYH